MANTEQNRMSSCRQKMDTTDSMYSRRQTMEHASIRQNMDNRQNMNSRQSMDSRQNMDTASMYSSATGTNYEVSNLMRHGYNKKPRLQETVDESFTSDAETEIYPRKFMAKRNQTRADPNQTVQLTPDEYQLGLEAVREFSLSSYGTERCVWADPMKNTGSSPGSSGVPSSGFTYRTANSIREAESESRSTSFECSSWPNDSIDSGIRNSSESKQQESVMKLRHRLDEAKQVFNPIRAKNSSRIQGRLFK